MERWTDMKLPALLSLKAAEVGRPSECSQPLCPFIRRHSGSSSAIDKSSASDCSSVAPIGTGSNSGCVLDEPPDLLSEVVRSHSRIDAAFGHGVVVVNPQVIDSTVRHNLKLKCFRADIPGELDTTA